MVCIYCDGDTKVYNSRHQKRNNQIWRRRRCLDCSATFTSIESFEYGPSLLVQIDHGYEPFLPDKLFSELLTALADRKNSYSEARELTNTIIMKLLKLPGSPVFTAKQISDEVLKILKRFDLKAWHRYSAERTNP